MGFAAPLLAAEGGKNTHGFGHGLAPGLISDEARLRALDRRALSLASEVGCRGGLEELWNSLLPRCGGCGVRNGDADILLPSTPADQSAPRVIRPAVCNRNRVHWGVALRSALGAREADAQNEHCAQRARSDRPASLWPCTRPALGASRAYRGLRVSAAR